MRFDSSLRRPVITAGVFILTALTACTGPTTPDRTPRNPTLPAASSAALLRPGDSLVVVLQGVPDPTTNAVQLDEQGVITLPFIGPIIAGGATTSELSQRVRETYISKKFYTTVDVSVSVTERFVYVGGEVQRPGRIVWTPDLTLTKAIQSAGGFGLYAKENAVTLVRDQGTYLISATTAQRSPADDPRLMPGDSLQVPRSPF